MSGDVGESTQAAAERSRQQANHRPLSGVTVVDFTRVLAGPTCTRTLVELGASVTKVEPPAGDVGRAGGPFVDGHCGYYLQLNGGKRNLSIDLNYPAARDAVFKLCAAADVVVENYRPGTMATFGLDYEPLAAANPRLVYVSMSGYGHGNSWSGRPAFAPTVQAESGTTATSLTHYGSQLRRPMADAASHADLYTGLHGVIATLAGLAQLARTGRGTHADVSMMATMLSVNERLNAEINGLETHGEPLALSAPESPIFELADGTMVTIAASPVWTIGFDRYCTMMGRNDLRVDPRFATPQLRRDNYDELMREVRSWISTFRTVAELEHHVSGAGGLAVGTIRSSGEAALETDWAHERLPTYEVDLGETTIRLPKGPWQFDGVDSGSLPVAADQGAHNTEVLREAGLSDDDIAALRTAGALAYSPAP